MVKKKKEKKEEEWYNDDFYFSLALSLLINNKPNENTLCFYLWTDLKEGNESFLLIYFFLLNTSYSIDSIPTSFKCFLDQIIFMRLKMNILIIVPVMHTQSIFIQVILKSIFYFIISHHISFFILIFLFSMWFDPLKNSPTISGTREDRLRNVPFQFHDFDFVFICFSDRIRRKGVGCDE